MGIITLWNFSMVKMLATQGEWNTAKAGKIIVDFTASWCGPCKMIGPVFEELSASYSNIEFVKVDVDELEDVAAECGISAMPTFQVWSNGAKIDELVGASADKLEELIKKHN